MASWSDPGSHVYVTGELVTPATLNTFVKDNLLYLFDSNHVSGPFSAVPPSLWSTNSAAFIDWGTLSFSFTKRGGTETALRFRLDTTGYATGAACLVQFGISVSGTTYSNSFPHYFNALSDHRHMGENFTVTGLGAGTYTCKPRVLVLGSAGTFNADGNDFVTILPEETPV